ncbi:hypothetical protein LEN26_004223 [Aphanomyces euteiches]|nr:hypothetical protein AeMF1_000694 [Aphanomyces euteiches]KAH9149579.1 hypothetical protein LEN26_004223 [Aphanomyces euteiches]
MRWWFLGFLLSLLVCHSHAQSNATVYLVVQWNNIDLNVIEANEDNVKQVIVGYVQPILLNQDLIVGSSASVTLLEIRPLDYFDTTRTQSFQIEMAFHALAYDPSALAPALYNLNVEEFIQVITDALTVASGSIMLSIYDIPTAPRLIPGSPPPTLTDFSAGLPYVLTKLHFIGQGAKAANFTGQYLTLSALTRIRYATYPLLDFRFQGFEDTYIMEVQNSTAFNITETTVLLFIRYNTMYDGHNESSIISKLLNGMVTPMGTTVYLANFMNISGFDFSNLNMAVEAPWIAYSNEWWLPAPPTTTSLPHTTTSPPTTTTSLPYTYTPYPTWTYPPTTIAPALDGGLVWYPYINAFNIHNPWLSPTYTQQGACLAQNQFCLHLKWIVDSSDVYILSRIKAQQYFNTSITASPYGPLISQSPTIWTLYDVPRSNILFDFVRLSDQSFVTVNITANLINTKTARAIVGSQSSNKVYTTFSSIPLEAKAVLLEIHLTNATKPPRVTQTYRYEGCVYCTKLAGQCNNDLDCSTLKTCVESSTTPSDRQNLITTGLYGDSLNTTLPAAACFSNLTASPGRTLFNAYMSCMLDRVCSFATQGPSRLIYRAPTPGWIQIQTALWSQQSSSSLPFVLSYGNNTVCPVVLFNQNNSAANLTAQINACVFGDCEVVVLVNTTSVMTIDVVFNNHIGPMPSIVAMASAGAPIVGYDIMMPSFPVTIVTKLVSSSAVQLMPIYDPKTNPVVLQDPCGSCWLDFQQSCLLDTQCNNYVSCIMNKAFPSIAPLVKRGAVGASFDLNPIIRSCSDASVPMNASWRALQNASHCYGMYQCPVASPGPNIVVWNASSRVQTITYNGTLQASWFQFKYQLDTTWRVLYGGPSDFGWILPSLVGFQDVSVAGPFNRTNADNTTTITWLATFPHYAGFLPVYSISDVRGIPLGVQNDAPASALLVVQPKPWNATTWNQALF